MQSPHLCVQVMQLEQWIAVHSPSAGPFGQSEAERIIQVMSRNPQEAQRIIQKHIALGDAIDNLANLTVSPHIILQVAWIDRHEPIIDCFNEIMKNKTGRIPVLITEGEQLVMRVDLERDDLKVDVDDFQWFLNRFKRNFQKKNMQLEWTLPWEPR